MVLKVYSHHHSKSSRLLERSTEGARFCKAVSVGDGVGVGRDSEWREARAGQWDGPSGSVLAGSWSCWQIEGVNQPRPVDKCGNACQCFEEGGDWPLPEASLCQPIWGVGCRFWAQNGDGASKKSLMLALMSSHRELVSTRPRGTNGFVTGEVVNWGLHYAQALCASPGSLGWFWNQFYSGARC